MPEVDVQQFDMNVTGNISAVFSEALENKLSSVQNSLEEAKIFTSASKVYLSSLKRMAENFTEVLNMAEMNSKIAEKGIKESGKQLEGLKSEINKIHAMAKSSIKNNYVVSNERTGTTNGADTESENETSSDAESLISSNNSHSESEVNSAYVFPILNPENNMASLNDSFKEVNRTLDCDLENVEAVLSSFDAEIPRDCLTSTEYNRQASAGCIADYNQDDGRIRLDNDESETNNKFGNDLSSNTELLQMTMKHNLDVTLDKRPENLDNGNKTFDGHTNLGNCRSCLEDSFRRFPSYSPKNVSNCITPSSVCDGCITLQDNLQQTSTLNNFPSEHVKKLSSENSLIDYQQNNNHTNYVKKSRNEDTEQLLDISGVHGHTEDFAEDVGHTKKGRMKFHETKSSKCAEDQVKYASGKYTSFHEELNEALSEYIVKSDRKDANDFLYERLQNLTMLTSDISINNSESSSKSPSYVTISEATTTDTSINDVSYTSVKKDTSLSDPCIIYQDSSYVSSNKSSETDGESSSRALSNDSSWTDATSSSCDTSTSECCKCKKKLETVSCSPSIQILGSSSNTSCVSHDFTDKSNNSDCEHLNDQNDVSYASFREGISFASLNNSEDMIYDSEENSNRCDNLENLNLLAETSLLELNPSKLVSSPYAYPSIRKSFTAANGTFLSPLVTNQYSCIQNQQNEAVASSDVQNGCDKDVQNGCDKDVQNGCDKDVSDLADSDVLVTDIEEIKPEFGQNIQIPNITITKVVTLRQ